MVATGAKKNHLVHHELLPGLWFNLFCFNRWCFRSLGGRVGASTISRRPAGWAVAQGLEEPERPSAVADGVWASFLGRR